MVGLTLWEPAVAVDAVQGAAQAVALVADHVKVAAWPAAIEAGAALNVTLGLAVTVTVGAGGGGATRARAGHRIGGGAWWA